MQHTITHDPVSRRKLLGGALAVAGAAATAGVVGGATGTARAAGMRPEGTTPDPPAELLFHLLPAPVRAYDSRVGQAPDGTDANTGAGDTALPRNILRTIDVCYALGTAMHPTGVPTTADGVMINLTITGTTGSGGNLKVWSHGVAEPSTSSINWDREGATLANMVTSAMAGGYLDVKCGGPSGASTHFLIDVVGYYTKVYTGP
jgi:hypothetical protein